MGLITSMNDTTKIKSGDYVTIRSHYGNGLDDAVWDLMKNGLIIYNIYNADPKHGHNWKTITFRATRDSEIKSSFAVVDVVIAQQDIPMYR